MTDYLNPEEAAALLRITVPQLRIAVRRRQIPVIRVTSRTMRFSRTDIERASRGPVFGPRKVKNRKDFFYLLRADTSALRAGYSLIKIGISDDPDKRIGGHCSNLPFFFTVSLLFNSKNAGEIEEFWKWELREYSSKPGRLCEFFLLPSGMLTRIKDHLREHSLSGLPPAHVRQFYQAINVSKSKRERSIARNPGKWIPAKRHWWERDPCSLYSEALCYANRIIKSSFQDASTPSANPHDPTRSHSCN